MNLPNPCRLCLAPAAALLVLVGLAGCNVAQPAQDDPTRYFILSGPAGQPGRPSAAPGGARVGLVTVRLEGYLKRREMVVRMGENEVQFRDFRLWAEPLDRAITRVVKASLLQSAGVAQVYTDPFPADSVRDYDVAIEVSRCEGSASRSGSYAARFTATIEVSTAGPNPHVVARKLFVAPAAAWDGENFGQLASLLSSDAAALGQEVASEISSRN